MPKTYPIVDLGGDPILNPAWPSNIRPVSWITRFVVHHTGTFRAHDYANLVTYQHEASYQNNTSIPGSRGLQYHYKIDNQGTISHVRPHNMLLWHCGDWTTNQHSLAICLDGNMSTQQPTREQIEALKQLLDVLSTQHPEFPADQDDVFGHRAVFATACPGNNLIGWVDSYRVNHGNVGIPALAFDWPELQPDFTPPPQPVRTEPDNPAMAPGTPPAPLPPPVPVVDSVSAPTGQASGPVPVRAVVEWQETFVSDPRNIRLKDDTAAIDVSGEFAPKHFSKEFAVAVQGHFQVDGRTYWGGPSPTGGFFGIPDADVLDTPSGEAVSTTPPIRPSAPRKGPAAAFLALCGWLIRALTWRNPRSQ